MADAFALPPGAGLGTAPMGGPGWALDWGPRSPDESVAVVRAAVAAGAGWIDTAPFYGWGRAEEIVGAALAGMTSPPVVLTKCGDVRGADGQWPGPSQGLGTDPYGVGLAQGGAGVPQRGGGLAERGGGERLRGRDVGLVLGVFASPQVGQPGQGRLRGDAPAASQAR